MPKYTKLRLKTIDQLGREVIQRILRAFARKFVQAGELVAATIVEASIGKAKYRQEMMVSVYIDQQSKSQTYRIDMRLAFIDQDVEKCLP